MNTPTTPTPDLESLRKAVQEFRPNPHRVPFNNLKPFHDSIMELRGKNASYFIIAEILQQNGVKTSRARVAEYGRIVLDGGKSRKRRKRAKTAPAANIPATSQSAPVVVAKPTLAMPPATAITSDVPSPQTESSPYRSRGPHIANVRMMKAEEAKEFNDSLKPKPPAS
jgi:predicted sugar kinase